MEPLWVDGMENDGVGWLVRLVIMLMATNKKAIGLLSPAIR
jgi:hypothetical protein